MRIGIVTTWFERGAAYVSRQYRQVLEKDHEVYVYARGGERPARGDPIWDDSKVTWGRRFRDHLMDMDLSHFRRWLKACRIEFVFFNEQRWWAPVLLCQQLGIPTGAYVDYYTEQTVPFFINYDLLVCNTRRHYSVFSWHPNGHYVPWGTDIHLFRPGDRFASDPEELVFFNNAGMDPERKGTFRAVRAFERLQSRARLIIHTQKSLAAYPPAIREGMRELMHSKRLLVREETVPAPGLYGLGDVYVYPSHLEGVGLSVAEAMACGLPVIVTDCPPMNEFVQDDRLGRRVRVAEYRSRYDGYYWPKALVDEEDLARQMEWFCDHKEALGPMRRFVREHAVRELDWSRNAAGVGALITSTRRLVSAEREEAVRRARAFDRKRQAPLSRWSPSWFAFAKSLWHRLKYPGC